MKVTILKLRFRARKHDVRIDGLTGSQIQFISGAHILVFHLLLQLEIFS